MHLLHRSAGHPFPTARELDEVAPALRLSHRWVLR